jgi:subtilisin family serine protease
MTAAAVFVVTAQPAVAAATSPPDPSFHITNDRYLSEQWSLFNFSQVIGTKVRGTRNADIQAPEAWAITRGDPKVIVAVLDSGVAYDHPDLAPNIWTNPAEIPGNGVDDDHNGYVDDVRGWDFVDNDNDPRDPGVSSATGSADTIAHGTAVASVVAARGDNSQGMTGVAPLATLLPVRALPSRGLDDATVARAIEYAAAAGARVINLSIATIIPGFQLPLVQAAIRRHPDRLFVASAGNAGNDADIVKPSPCAMDSGNVLCVAATDQNDELARFGDAVAPASNYGRTTVDLGAPGAAMLVAQPAQQVLWPPDGSGKVGWSAGGTPGGWRVDAHGLHGTPTGGDSWLRTASTVDLSGQSGCRLSFTVRSSLAGIATVFLETSTGLNGWVLRPGVNGFSLTGPTNGQPQTASVPLPAAAGEGFGFRLQGGQPNGGEVTLTDPRISCLSANYTGREYAYAEGTSFAAPEVAGAAALIWAAHPDLDLRRVHEALLDGAVPLPALAGKTVTGGRLDVYRSLLAAADQPMPAPPAESRSSGTAVPTSPVPDATPTSGGLVPDLLLPLNPIADPLSRSGLVELTPQSIEKVKDVSTKLALLVAALAAAAGVGIGTGLKYVYKNILPLAKQAAPWLVGLGVGALVVGILVASSPLGLALMAGGGLVLAATTTVVALSKLSGMYGDSIISLSAAGGEAVANAAGNQQLSAGFKSEKDQAVQSLVDHQGEYVGQAGSVIFEQFAGKWSGDVVKEGVPALPEGTSGADEITEAMGQLGEQAGEGAVGPVGEQLVEDGTKYDELRAEQAASTGTSAEPGAPAQPSGPAKPVAKPVEAPAAGNVPLHGRDGQLDLTPPAELTVTGQVVPQASPPPATGTATAVPGNKAPAD